MSEARFRVVSVGPMVSIQDAGRSGLMRFGVPASGPMDRFAHACANRALGVDQRAAAIEISMGGLELECLSGEITLSVVGACGSVAHNDINKSSWSVLSLQRGERLSVRAGAWGSFSYLGFLGTLCCDQWLGHAATYSLADFGGGMLVQDQEIVVHNAQVREDREGALTIPDVATTVHTADIVLGPQNQHFAAESIAVLTQESFTLSAAFDRMGVRLVGPSLAPVEALSIPSEPIVRGSLQVSGEGVPTVLLADHQTTGGYPKIATMVSTDTDRFAQLRAGDTIRFQVLSSADAVAKARTVTAQRDEYFDYLSKPRGSLAHRLMHENLIDGVVTGSEDTTVD